MAQQNQLGTTATAVFTDDDGFTKVVYHDTKVLQFNNDTIKLNTGGWFTSTTKTRMNQASNQFMLGYNVMQRAGKWFAVCDSRIVPQDGTLTIPFNGDTLELERA